jgi:drug/metabolite transporter (DMT)-like permease
MISRARLGIGCALAAASIYGLVPNFIRGAFENGIPPSKLSSGLQSLRLYLQLSPQRRVKVSKFPVRPGPLSQDRRSQP